VVVVSNSSPLIALARIERLSLLSAIFESVLIPPAVAREIAPSIPIAPPWLRLRPATVPLSEQLARRRLGDGELEAITLAVEINADQIILDDLAARRLAEVSGLNVIGTLGLLLGARRAGLIDRIRPELDSLRTTSFFLSPELYADLLREAGEE
jgi:predicted nucleic acid-binding protein